MGISDYKQTRLRLRFTMLLGEMYHLWEGSDSGGWGGDSRGDVTRGGKPKGGNGRGGGGSSLFHIQ